MMLKSLAAAGFVMLSALSAVPATAQMARFTPGLKEFSLTAEQIQWRDGYRGGHRYGYRRGPGAGALVGGLAAGALLGGIIASQAPPGYGAPVYGDPVYDEPNAIAYCSQRFRSYDPASGTYLGYDGQRHSCP